MERVLQRAAGGAEQPHTEPEGKFSTEPMFCSAKKKTRGGKNFASDTVGKWSVPVSTEPGMIFLFPPTPPKGDKLSSFFQTDSSSLRLLLMPRSFARLSLTTMPMLTEMPPEICHFRAAMPWAHLITNATSVFPSSQGEDFQLEKKSHFPLKVHSTTWLKTPPNLRKLWPDSCPGLARRITWSPIHQGPVVFCWIWWEFPPATDPSKGRLSPHFLSCRCFPGFALSGVFPAAGLALLQRLEMSFLSHPLSYHSLP